MMRLNAPLSALLALAALFLIPATLLAKPARPHARKTATAHRQTKKVAVNSSHSVKRQKVSRTQISHASHSRSRSSKSPHHLTHTAKTAARKSASRRAETADASPRKATAADFLKAAATKSEGRDTKASVHEEDAASSSPRARVRRTKKSKNRSVARPVPVVNVIRPTAERPQLQSVQQEAAAPAILPTLYNKRGRLIVPPPLKGSREILLHQNEVADREGLDRIQNHADLLDMRSKRILVPLPASYALAVDDRLPEDRRYCRPWTSQFLSNMARAHYARFHTPLQINSAVRTVEFQQHLIRINGNAAPAEGDTASPHLTGQAIDIAKHGLSRTEVAWMRGYLLPIIQEGKIDVEEEFQQACFHISVYKKYLPPADAPRRDLASHRHSEASALATAIR
jgi:hypothetical protein